MKTFIQHGDVLTLTAPADVASGVGVLVGAIFGITAFSAVSGDPVEVKTTGVYELPKTSAQALATLGLAIYWDDSAKVLTTTATGNTFVGVNTEVAANPSGSGKVRLNGIFGIRSSAQSDAAYTAA